jgi:3-hydroxyacyl-CoA dehydrogenase / 3-hydroxy-2-methylbutyryl-CoA dehydrogenase
MLIQDKVIVITGGASGLGLATAQFMVREKGARVAIFDLNQAAGGSAVGELGAERAMFVCTDVSSEEDVLRAVDAVIGKFGAIHVCINAAALPTSFKMLDKTGNPVPLARFAQITSVNLNGVFNVMSKCVAKMASNDPENGEERGVIINISSGAAYQGQIGQTAYSATKAGVIGMNIPAARELGDLGIRVNAVVPGLFLTKMVSELPEKVLDSLRAQMEAPRRLGNMREFAHACAFIIENGYVNGEAISLDGAARLRSR